MPRRGFDQHLAKLQDDILVLASMVEKAIDRSVEGLKNRDLDLAKQVIADDVKINHKRFQIEEECILLIATQQPVADDLRLIIAALHMITDMERIGDHARGIGDITVMIGDEPPLKPLVDIPRMARKTTEMMRHALDAFIKRDAELARQVCARDNEVDDLYDQVFRELLSFMIEDPRTITRATRLLWVAHNLERSADRVTNIAERVVFILGGRMEEIEGSYY